MMATHIEGGKTLEASDLYQSDATAQARAHRHGLAAMLSTQTNLSTQLSRASQWRGGSPRHPQQTHVHATIVANCTAYMQYNTMFATCTIGLERMLTC